MAHTSDDPFRPAPLRTPPIRTQLEIANRLLDQLRKRLATTSGIVKAFFTLAGEVRDDKFCGCERCSGCSMELSELINKWLMEVQWNDVNLDSAIVSVASFVNFPRAALRLLSACLDTMAHPEQTDNGRQLRINAGVFMAEIKTLCELARLKFKDRSEHFLPVARIARVLQLLSPRLEEQMSGLEDWVTAKTEIASVIEIAETIEAHLVEPSLFAEDRWIGYDHKVSRTGTKRIEGGGILHAPLREGEPDPEPAYVVDFSKTHVLVSVNTPISGVHRNWVFFPTQRELPFELSFFPAKRLDESGPVKVDSALAQAGCGKHYQLLQITKSSPSYYYASLCARAISKHTGSAGARMVDAHDWPDPPAFNEPK